MQAIRPDYSSEKKLLTTDWGKKDINNGAVDNFIWKCEIYFVSLRAGWVEYRREKE